MGIDPDSGSDQFHGLGLAALLGAQNAQHVMGKEIAGIGLDDLNIKARRVLQTPALVTSGCPVAERFQVHPVHRDRAASQFVPGPGQVQLLGTRKEYGGHPKGWPPQIFNRLSLNR